MTANEFDALIQWQEEKKAQLLATLGLLDAFIQDVKALQEAQEQIKKAERSIEGRLVMSMEVFDPGYEWDNTGAYEN